MLKRQLVLGIAQATQPGSGQPSIHAAGSGTHRPRFLSSAHTDPPPHMALWAPSTRSSVDRMGANLFCQEEMQ